MQLECGGLISENYDKDFISEFDKSDIVMLTETHIGYEHNIQFDNFYFYAFCREKSKNNRYFGGLGILIRKSIKVGIKFINNGTSEYQRLKLCKEFFSSLIETFTYV